MLNLVGAYIVTLLLAGIFLQGPKLSEVSEKLSKLPLGAHLALQAFLVYLGYASLFMEEARIPWGLPYLILDGFNFWVHEAGHAYCMFFGKTLHVLGGTLLQIGLPLSVALRAHMRKYRTLSAIMIFWTGQNLPSVGRYVSDARAQALPISGGGEHDWAFLLAEYGLLKHDTALGSFITGCGGLIMLCGLFYYFWLSLERKSGVEN